MKTSFEESKHFKLTRDEETFLNMFLDMYLKIYGNSKPSSYVLNREIAEKICIEVEKKIPNIEKNNLGWFIGRSVSEGCSGIRVEGWTTRKSTYTKILPDRSEFTFTHENLRKSLYDLGRFYLARQFDHRYGDLTAISDSWKRLDDYIVQRQQIIKLDTVVNVLPELEGMF